MSRPNAASRRRAFTVVELLIAVSITAIMGLAIGSMMTMVGTVSDADREGRGVLMRAQAGQSRLRAYVDPSLRILGYDTSSASLVVWLHDATDVGSVNLTEIRVITTDDDGVLAAERVQFPESWTAQMVELANIPLPPGTDYLATMAAQRALGQTVTQPLLSGVSAIGWAFPGAAKPEDATRALAMMVIDSGEDTTRTFLFAYGLVDHVPEE